MLVCFVCIRLNVFSQFSRDEDYFQTHSKKELIDTAKMISWASSKLVKQAKEIADKCPDKRMRGVSLVTPGLTMYSAHRGDRTRLEYLCLCQSDLGIVSKISLEFAY